jgi:hypothetical protein
MRHVADRPGLTAGQVRPLLSVVLVQKIAEAWARTSTNQDWTQDVWTCHCWTCGKADDHLPAAAIT